MTKLLAISRQESVCRTVINLNVANATLEDVISRIKTTLPGQTVIVTARGASPVRMGFDLKGARVGDVLQSVANLAGCKLFVLQSGLLIAPAPQLTDAERQDIKQMQGGEWAKSVVAGGSGWSLSRDGNLAFAKAIAQEVTGGNAKPFPATVLKTNFGNLSPDSQTMSQQIVTWAVGAAAVGDPNFAPLWLGADSPITIDTSDPGAFNFRAAGGTSNPSGTSVSGKINLH